MSKTKERTQARVRVRGMTLPLSGCASPFIRNECLALKALPSLAHTITAQLTSPWREWASRLGAVEHMLPLRFWQVSRTIQLTSLSWLQTITRMRSNIHMHHACAESTLTAHDINHSAQRYLSACEPIERVVAHGLRHRASSADTSIWPSRYDALGPHGPSWFAIAPFRLLRRT